MLQIMYADLNVSCQGLLGICASEGSIEYELFPLHLSADRIDRKLYLNS